MTPEEMAARERRRDEIQAWLDDRDPEAGKEFRAMRSQLRDAEDIIAAIYEEGDCDTPEYDA